MPKIRDLTEVVFWSAAAWLLASNSNAIIVFALRSVYGDPAAAPALVLQNLIYVSPVFPVILGMLAVLRLKIGRENILRMVGLSGKTLPLDASIGAAAGIAAIGIAVVSLQAAARYSPPPPVHLMPPAVHVYFMTIGAIVPGVCEELYFRGMLLKVGQRLPKAAIILLGAAAFSAWHIGTPAYLPHTFLLGLLFGVMTIFRGRLAPAIIAHSIANAGMGVLFLAGFKIAAQ